MPEIQDYTSFLTVSLATQGYQIKKIEILNYSICNLHYSIKMDNAI